MSGVRKFQPPKAPPVKLTVLLPPDVAERLRKFAMRRRQPVGELIREGIERVLPREAATSATVVQLRPREESD